MVKYSRDMPELSGKKFLSSVLMLSMDIEAWENIETKEIRGHQKMDYVMYKILNTNFKVATKLKSRTETQKINKEKTKKHSTKNCIIQWVDQNRQDEEQRKCRNWKTSDIMTALSLHTSIITLNVPRLNSPIKRHRVARWIKEQDPTICCLQETYLSSNDKYRLRVKGGR
uniref:Endonuclease/exonuclease/phosphatase domain-containing protein n=1 Tax=Equus caballus TaxID=9796 RepID=A0A9L0T0U1_HORSE